MTPETTQAFCRLLTAYVEAIESAGYTLPADVAQRLANNPLGTCEMLNELALNDGVIDEPLDVALADIYQAMDAADARSKADPESLAQILAALEQAHREPPEPEPKSETEAGQHADNAANAAEPVTQDGDEAPAEPRPRKSRGRKPRRAPEHEAEEPEAAPTPEAPDAQAAGTKTANAPAATEQPQHDGPTSHGEDGSQPAYDDQPALTVDQAAAILGVNRQKVYKLIESKRLPAHKKGRSWQISPSDLAALEA